MENILIRENSVIIKKARLNKVMTIGQSKVELIYDYGKYYLASNDIRLNGSTAYNTHGYRYTWVASDSYPNSKYACFYSIPSSFIADTKKMKKKKAYCRARGIPAEDYTIRLYRERLSSQPGDMMANRKIVKCCYSGVYLYDVNGIETFDGVAHKSYLEHLVPCVESKKLIHKGDAIAMSRGRFIHESYKHLLSECMDCGGLEYKTDTYDVFDRTICFDCYGNYTECSSCGTMCHTDNLTSYDFGYCCPNCSSDVHTCDECGEEFLDTDNECVCDDCLSSTIKGYRTKFKNLPDYGDKMMFGVEMEFEVYTEKNPSIVARHFKNELGNVIMIKEDGSIDYGFEVVTKPLSMEDAIDVCKKICDCSQKGCYESSTTGVHIHISKAALSQIQICKMISIFGELESDIVNIARRSSSSWAKISKKKFAKIREEGYSYFIQNEREERYRAINLQNEHTVEFRVFSGTMDKSTIEAYILFVSAIVIASKKISGVDVDNGLTSEKIFSYVSKNKRYDNLRTYLSSVGVEF